MERTVASIAQYLNGKVIGDGTVLISGINTLEAAQSGDMSFADSPQRLARALATPSSAIIVSSHVGELGGRSGISVSNPKLAFALVLELFHPAALVGGSVHPSAVLGKRVQLQPKVSIGPHVTIGNDVAIGRGSLICAGAVIEDGVAIGANSMIGPNVVLYRSTIIGNHVRIHAGSVIGGDGFGYIFHDGRHVKVPQVGNVVIEDDVEIGCNVCIDRATVGSTLIRRGTKIDNLVQIGHNNRIGQHVVIAGQAGFSGSVTVGDYSVFGGRAGVTDHVTIGTGAQVGLCSIVTKSVPARAVVLGFPARQIRAAKEQLALVARLPGTLKRLAAALAKIGLLEERMRRYDEAKPRSVSK